MRTAVKIQRSAEERDRMIEQYLPLVRYVVARLPVTMPASLDKDDFYSVGVIGLMHAATTYDPARGASWKRAETRMTAPRRAQRGPARCARRRAATG